MSLLEVEHDMWHVCPTGVSQRHDLSDSAQRQADTDNFKGHRDGDYYIKGQSSIRGNFIPCRHWKCILKGGVHGSNLVKLRSYVACTQDIRTFHVQVTRWSYFVHITVICRSWHLWHCCPGRLWYKMWGRILPLPSSSVLWSSRHLCPLPPQKVVPPPPLTGYLHSDLQEMRNTFTTHRPKQKQLPKQN